MMLHRWLLITLIISFTPFVQAGFDWLYVPYNLFGRNKEETLSIYKRRGQQFGYLENVQPLTLSNGEQYYQVPYSDYAQRGIDNLVRDEQLWSPTRELPWDGSNVEIEKRLKTSFSQVRKALDKKDHLLAEARVLELLAKVKKGGKFKDHEDAILNKLLEWNLCHDRVVHSLADVQARHQVPLEEIIDTLEKSSEDPTVEHLIEMALKFVTGADRFPKNLDKARNLIRYIFKYGSEEDKNEVLKVLESSNDYTGLKSILLKEVHTLNLSEEGSSAQQSSSSQSQKRDKGKEKVDEDYQVDEDYEEREPEENEHTKQKDSINQTGDESITFLDATFPEDVVFYILNFLYTKDDGETNLKTIGLVSRNMHRWSKAALLEFRNQWIKLLLKSLNTYKQSSQEFTQDERERHTSQLKAVISFLEGVSRGVPSATLDRQDIQKIEEWILRIDHRSSADIYRLRLSISRILLFETGRFHALVTRPDYGIPCLIQYYKKHNSPSHQAILSEIKSKGIDVHPRKRLYKDMCEFGADILSLYRSLTPDIDRMANMDAAEEELIFKVLNLDIMMESFSACFPNMYVGALPLDQLYPLITFLFLNLKKGVPIFTLAAYVEKWWNGVASNMTAKTVEQPDKTIDLLSLKREILQRTADYLEEFITRNRIFATNPLNGAIRELYNQIYASSCTWEPKEYRIGRFKWYLSLHPTTPLRQSFGGPILK